MMNQTIKTFKPTRVSLLEVFWFDGDFKRYQSTFFLFFWDRSNSLGTHQPSLNPKAKAPPNINPQRTKRRISKFSSVLIPFTPDLRYPKRRQSPDLDRPSPPTRRRVQVVIPFVPNLPPRPPSPGLSTPQVPQSWSPKSCSKLRFQSHIYRSPRRTWRAKTFDRRSVDSDFMVASDNEALDTESSLSQLESDSDSIASNTSSHSDDEAECPAT